MHKPGSVSARLEELFKRRFAVDICAMSGEFCDRHLLCRDIGMRASDLLYLYFDVEEEFGISIPEEEVAAGKFNTFNNIAGIISKQLKKKDDEAAEFVDGKEAVDRWIMSK